MGYCTGYTLTIQSGETDLEQVRTTMKKLSGHSFEVDLYEIRSYEPIKWYEHTEDMITLSRDFPGVIFKLSGFGEGMFDETDVWDKYYLDGKLIQNNHARYIGPPPFNPDLVKEQEEIDLTGKS